MALLARLVDGATRWPDADAQLATVTFAAHMEVLPAAQAQLWQSLAHLQDRFVLYGTAIALRLGHRSSVDFDLFSDQPLDPDESLQQNAWLRQGDVLQLQPNTLTVSVFRDDPVKVSLFGDISFGRAGSPEW